MARNIIPDLVRSGIPPTGEEVFINPVQVIRHCIQDGRGHLTFGNMVPSVGAKFVRSHPSTIRVNMRDVVNDQVSFIFYPFQMLNGLL